MVSLPGYYTYCKIYTFPLLKTAFLRFAFSGSLWHRRGHHGNAVHRGLRVGHGRALAPKNHPGPGDEWQKHGDFPWISWDLTKEMGIEWDSTQQTW